MRRSFIDIIRGLYHSLSHQDSEQPVELRVENARMSQTRLKALKPNDSSMDYKMPMAVPIDATDPTTLSKRVTTLAGMSHYRLAALAAILPPDRSDEFESEVSFEDGVVEASRSEYEPTIPVVADDEFIDESELERCAALAY